MPRSGTARSRESTATPPRHESGRLAASSPSAGLPRFLRSEPAPEADPVHQIAEQGVSGSAGSLPHLSAIQQAFGPHDVSAVQAHVGGDAAQAARGIQAQAYTVGEHIAFREAPSLHTAAHEAAHVLQQRGGVVLPGGVGQGADRYERHADAVADAVVGHRPLGPLLQHLVGAAGATPAVQAKDATSEDVDAIAAAGKRAQTDANDDTRMMLDGASIVFRLLRTFFPASLEKWNFSGVDYQRDLDGITMRRSGKDVAVTVGRKFVIEARDRVLSSRIIEMRQTLEVLDANSGGMASVSTGATTGPATWADAIAEAGRVLARDAKFGVTAGSAAGPDPNDGFDARYWKESGRSIEATVEPWVAMSQMVAHLAEPVPKVGGGTTRWRFDCFEGAEVERLYADWRMLSREAFNKKNAPLKIGFMSYLFDRMEGTRPEYFQKPVKSDKAGDKPYTEGEDRLVRLPSGEYKNVIPKILVNQSMDQVLDAAPTGSWVIWTNDDVTRRIADHKKRKAAGLPITEAETAHIARIDPWNNENALKVDKDRFSAFPFGVVSEKEIVQGMAAVVFDPDPVPAGYIEKNIRISAISAPK
jgi:hypothetical protein